MNKFIKLGLLTPVVATPVLSLSSCGSNWVEQINMVNMLDPSALPSVTPLQSDEVMTQADAINFYIANASSNQSLFVADVLRGSEHFINSFKTDREGLTLTKFELGFTNPTFGTSYIAHISEHDELVHTISFKQRIHLVYESDNGSEHVTNDVLINIDYQNVLFCVYESTKEDVRWCVSMLDHNIGTESCWYYQFDLQPWSISYSCADKLTKIVKGSGDTPDIEINNADYYSANVDTASKLYYTYLYAQQEKTDDNKSEWFDLDILSMILLLNHQSTLLSEIDRDADLRLWSPLYAELEVTAPSVLTEDLTTVDFGIKGLMLFQPRAEKVDLDQPGKIQLTNDENIKLTEDSELKSSWIDVNKNIKDDVNWHDSAEDRYTIPATLHIYLTPVVEKIETTIKYTFDVDTLNFKIWYYKNGEWVGKDVQVRLHYKSFTLYLTINPATSQN